MANKLEILKTYSDSITFTDALELAKGRRIASNLQIDAILQDDKARSEFSGLFPCFTGTLLAYNEVGKPFGKYIKDSSSGIIIDVPKEFQGSKNKALVLEHPDFSISKSDYDLTFIKPAKLYEISCIDFPESDGWYLPKDFGIPNGECSSSSNKNARYLWRRSSDSVRPVSRGYDGFYGIRRVVICDDGFVIRLGVALVKGATASSKKAKVKKHG